MNLLTFAAPSADNFASMPFWLQALIALCAVAITVALVPALLALRRAGERAERVFGIVEQELPSLVAEVRRLVEELRGLGQEMRDEVARVGTLLERVREVSAGVGRALTALGGLTRAGQVVGVAAGLKTGLDVFVHRLRRRGGEDHG